MRKQEIVLSEIFEILNILIGTYRNLLNFFYFLKRNEVTRFMTISDSDHFLLRILQIFCINVKYALFKYTYKMEYKSVMLDAISDGEVAVLCMDEYMHPVLEIDNVRLQDLKVDRRIERKHNDSYDMLELVKESDLHVDISDSGSVVIT